MKQQIKQRKPLASKEERLMEHCRKFIQKQEITCDETVYQTDRVIENAYDFIAKVCKIVGYHKDEE